MLDKGWGCSNKNKQLTHISRMWKEILSCDIRPNLCHMFFLAFCRFSRSWKRKMLGMPEHLLLIRVSWTSAQLVETHCYGAIQDIGHTVISVSTNTQIWEIFSAAHHSYAVGIFIQVSQFGTVILQFSVHFQHQIIKTLVSSARRQDDPLQCWSGKSGCDRAGSWGFFFFDFCTGLLWQSMA